MLLSLLGIVLAHEAGRRMQNTDAASCGETTTKVNPMQVVLVIDGSGSVSRQGFENQIRLANGVLSTAREFYNDSDATWNWGAMTFATQPYVVKEMHADEGDKDELPSTLLSECLQRLAPEVCGTFYKPALEKAVTMFKPDISRKIIWFLTDGMAADLPDKRSMLQFRQDLFQNDTVKIASVYLTPLYSSIVDAKGVLQTLSCVDPNTQCDDHVLTGDTSADMTSFAGKVRSMFQEVVERTVVTKPCAVPPPDTTTPPGTTPSETTTEAAAEEDDSLWLILAAVAAVLVCCCCLLVISRAKPKQDQREEDIPMTQTIRPDPSMKARRLSTPSKSSRVKTNGVGTEKSSRKGPSSVGTAKSSRKGPSSTTKKSKREHKSKRTSSHK